MATVAIVFRKDKINNDGIAPIHFRITKDRKVRYISSSIKVHQSNWDNSKKEILRGHKNSARFNALLATKYAEVQNQVIDLEQTNKSITTKHIKDKIYGKTAVSYFEVAEDLLETYREKNKYGTYDKCKSMLNKTKEFLKGKDIFFQDIDPQFIAKYEKWLRVVKNNKINTIAGNLRFIRRVFNYAVRYDLIEHNINPFHKVKITTEKTSRVYLTEDELARIEALELKAGSRLDLHRDMFIFACYAGGPRISDILTMKWQQYDGMYIQYTSMKTITQVEIKLPNKALEIVKKHRPDDVDGNHFLFPMLNNELDMNDAKYLDTSITKANSYINKNLIDIGKKANIDKHISFHVSRHTWATRALRKGITIEKVAKILGHADLRQTLIYAKIIGEDLDKAMDAFNV
jgi:integrase/recombinase XerD